MNRTELIHKILEGIENIVQSKVYGEVFIQDDLLRNTYILYICSDINFAIDIGDSVESIVYDLASNDINGITNYIKLAEEICEKYKEAILTEYFVNWSDE